MSNPDPTASDNLRAEEELTSLPSGLTAGSETGNLAVLAPGVLELENVPGVPTGDPAHALPSTGAQAEEEQATPLNAHIGEIGTLVVHDGNKHRAILELT